MRMCLHPSHRDPNNPQSRWILDDEPDHEHDKPRLRFVDGEWRVVEDRDV